MQKRTPNVSNPKPKARAKAPKEKPTPTEPKPSPSANGQINEAEPFDLPPRSWYASAAQLPAEAQTYIWKPYIPENCMTLLVGDSGAGKSTMLSALAAALTRGDTLHRSCGHSPKRVLVFSPEESVRAAVRPRLEAMKARLSMVFWGDFGSDLKPLPRLSLPNESAKLCERIKAMKISLVTIDPIQSYLAPGFNPNSDPEVRNLLDTLSQVAQEASCTIVLTRHYRKSGDGGPLDRIGGSAAWGHHPRTVLACGFDPDDPEKKILAVSKCMMGKTPPSLCYTTEETDNAVRFVIGETSHKTARDLGIAGLAPTERDALAEAEAFLRDALSDGPVPCNDLKAFAFKNMISEITLRRAKGKMCVVSKLVVNAGTKYVEWRLPDIELQR